MEGQRRVSMRVWKPTYILYKKQKEREKNKWVEAEQKCASVISHQFPNY